MHQKRDPLSAILISTRAKIRDIDLNDFCRQLQPDSFPSLTLPSFCAVKDPGIGSPNYFLALAAISAASQAQQIVEFGTFLGASASIFALNAPGSAILTIDLPDEGADVSNLDRTDKNHVQTSRRRVGELFKGTPQAERITELKCDSRKLRLKDHVRSADLIYVDGGHNLECITADTMNAFEVAHPGSIVLWDDYFWFYPEVVTYLEGLLATKKLVRIQGTNVVAHICENSLRA